MLYSHFVLILSLGALSNCSSIISAVRGGQAGPGDVSPGIFAQVNDT